MNRNEELNEMFNNLEANKKEALIAIATELQRAEIKFPEWPNDTKDYERQHGSDPIVAAAIVAEESGELIRAALQFVYEDGNELAMQKEAIQTGAMAVRFLINM